MKRLWKITYERATYCLDDETDTIRPMFRNIEEQHVTTSDEIEIGGVIDLFDTWWRTEHNEHDKMIVVSVTNIGTCVSI